MKIKKITDGAIEFDNGNVLEFFHYTSCCEQVYADTRNIQAMSHVNFPVYEAEFDENLVVEMVSGIGVQLINVNGMKYLISCYDSQNGYYSDQLEMYYFTAEQYNHFIEHPYDYITGRVAPCLSYINNVEKKLKDMTEIFKTIVKHLLESDPQSERAKAHNMRAYEKWCKEKKII